MKNTRLAIVVVFVLAGLLVGCQAAVPLVMAFKEIGATESDRMNLLKDQVKDFQRAMEAGNAPLAVQYVKEDKPEVRDQLIKDIRRSKRKEHIVEHKFDMVTYADAAREADVEVIVKYYEVPYYIVNERLEKQAWAFTMNTGWQLAGRTVEKLEY